MKKIQINNCEYELIKDYKAGFDASSIIDKCIDTDYFNDYDYIFGDWAYSKLRLKGLCDKDNPKYNATNAYDKIDDYIKNYCAYDCRYFIIKKIKKDIVKSK